MRAVTRLRSVLSAFAVVAGTLALAAGPGSPAQAVPVDGGSDGAGIYGVEIVKAAGQVGNYQRKEVSCPSNKVAVGGGAEVSNGHDEWDEVLAVTGSFPLMNAEGTHATGWVAHGRFDWIHQAPMTVTAYAICAWMPNGYEVVDGGSVPVPWDQAATVTCPAGKVAIGGGGEAPADDDTGLSSSYPSYTAGSATVNQWTVGGYNRASSTTNIHAYAVCSFPVHDLSVVRYAGTGENPVGGLLKCPDGKIVTGGGFNGSERTWGSLHSNRPAKAAETGSKDGWWAKSGNPRNSDFELYVMCVNP